MKLIVEKEKNFKLNFVTQNILESVSFWNSSHEEIRAKNMAGTFGNKRVTEYAQNTEHDDWLNEMIFRDCKTFVYCETARKMKERFECGRTRSHVWIHQDGERVLMIYAK